MSKILRALISVSDKTGLVEFARELAGFGVEIVSTGGTARVLREAGLSVLEVSEFTGFPEMLDGRVKTLHPKVHGGLLYVRGNAEHEAAVARHGIRAIDLVVVNLYPFEKTVARPDVTLQEAIENIDIGGPAMLRSAAKNHASVTVVVDPADYSAVLAEMRSHNGETTPELRARLAAKVFAVTSRYDGTIAAFLGARAGGSGLPETFTLSLPKAQDLRYGENPHQRAALYGDFAKYFEQLHGKELSYNNILDLAAAAELVAEFTEPTVAIVKHTNPCGVGSASTLKEAWELAYATDRQAPFGGIIAANVPLDAGTAMAIAEIFSEVIIAPDFEREALEVLQRKKNLRLIRQRAALSYPLSVRTAGGCLLVQEPDTRLVSADEIRVVTRRRPTQAERHGMLFGWRVVKHVKSNAVVFAVCDGERCRTLGIGAGQMSRVDSTKIAIWKAREAGLSLEGSVVASDAFFPFPDAVVAAAEAGATAVIQPGGSVRDTEVIAAANERNLAMVFTGIRHFRH
ncbi:MAG: bifunctional phosphoribosylaminoimidazolecarboxamide formyltransferase/IMP cyclohydrolase [Verrucomicrobiae bacterium]|nr:bifunctional phosphoribosylaminoimidazolecarboxamide formyltransferase/IMP cyclohydrolase [Verrucomicrobiae bacterium]